MIRFTDGYRYQLKRGASFPTHFRPPTKVTGHYGTLFPSGRLLIRKGYAWDGPSGPAVDTPSFQQGALVHDRIYQFLRSGKVLHEEGAPGDWRRMADELLHEMVLADGMSRFRAWWVLRAVRRFAGDAASPNSKKPILTAP